MRVSENGGWALSWPSNREIDDTWWMEGSDFGLDVFKFFKPTYSLNFIKIFQNYK